MPGGVGYPRGAARWLLTAAVLLLAGYATNGGPVGLFAQAGAAATRRHATTIDALLAYPVFFHSHSVRVRGVLRGHHQELVLAQGDRSLPLVGPAAAGLVEDPSVTVEVTGSFLDVGRLTEGDPRLGGIDVEGLSSARLGKAWPGAGELLLIAAEAVAPAERPAAPSIRTLALDPERYLETSVTVVGRFRGRNLYGDQPDAPGRSRWDFVLQSADASVWVVNLRPRGSGFNLDVTKRVDTGRWLEVVGTVRRERHMVVLEATEVRAAKPPAEPPPSEAVARVPAVGPPPEVLFSVPTADETDVPPSTRVRIQFSRGLAPESLVGQITVSYTGAQPGDAEIRFSTSYDEGLRVLDIRFDAPLAAFRTVKVELLEGIEATDGAHLAPWSLTFTVGS